MSSRYSQSETVRTDRMEAALFGRNLRSTERGKLLDTVLRLRDRQAWITIGCYAWWRYEGYIEAAQRKLVEWRQGGRDA